MKKIKQVFNIYGITEISCWSTIEEITESLQEISLGHVIDNETIIEVRNLEDKSVIIHEGIGELYLGSHTRKCLIDNEDIKILQLNEICYRSTGDLVSIDEKNKKLIFKGRTNEIIKRYGHRVNLRKIEELIKTHWQISNVYCVFDQNDNHLILFLNTTEDKISESLIRSYLSDKLQNHEIPDNIIFIDRIPLSYHGKVSKIKLLEIYKEQKERISQNINGNDVLEIFEDWIIQILKFQNSTKRHKLSWNEVSFKNIGGNSFQALNLVTKLENLTKKSHPDILEMLLNDDCTLNAIFLKLKTFRIDYNIKKCDNLESNEDFDMKILWKFDMKKCIDSNPTLISESAEILISVGSHSHLLVNVNANTGRIISSLELPDRIESQVAAIIIDTMKFYGIVGCYDGYLYKFDLHSGEILWKFNSFGMIKCKSLIFKDFVIFGNYSNEENLFCLNLNDVSFTI